MNFRGLIAAAIVLAGLGGALYWSKQHPPETSTPSSTQTTTNILTIGHGKLSRIVLNKKGEPQVVLTRERQGPWKITAPKAYGADQAELSTLVSSLSSLSADRLIEERATNLEQYGLNPPEAEIEIAEEGKLARKLLIGEDTPTGTAAYVQLAGDARLFTIPISTREIIVKDLNTLRDKRLITLNADAVNRVEVTSGQQKIAFAREQDRWRIAAPSSQRADGTQVEELLRRLTDTKIDLSSDPGEARSAAAFANGTPVAMAKLTAGSETQEIQIRKQKDEFYAKSSAADRVYKAAGDLGTAFDKKLEDFRSKKVFDFGYSDVSKIELHDGDKAYFLTRKDADWWSKDGKKMDAVAVDTLLSRIRDLEASSFPQSGFKTASIELNVTSNEGKRLEKVLISRDGDNYLAKHEGKSTLYMLSAQAVEEIQKLVRELKPATS